MAILEGNLIKKLPNGRFEVSSGRLKERFDTENSLIKQLEDCRESNE